ncbi:hypothetical protein POSPLADRAFT_1066767 [Postia placenta MAD-698-R-SB12]|uniref:Uncharacterized protein n=1 Tax=Postia placenta MAD-698-R-SB12 TaxID=670580 RepID=A0A1X6MW06_9APHY|nr:hypothetical protein POSPLADRAFT_1066767 [Postia placenta MAD-698-R-SB12]OSX60529.1 hypothetical protein POSPLADRAFT_1066767 [Postia placenta MAD-698-R-SB12]
MVSPVVINTQISALYPSAHPIPVPTIQNYIHDAPAPHPSNLPPEHANHAAFCRSAACGIILLRVTHWGRMLELVSLSSDIPPLRFDFPSRLLPYPALWQIGGELCLVALTEHGSLYRILIPIREGKPAWSPQSNRQVCNEYVVQGMKGSTGVLVAVQGEFSVAIHLSNGTLLRLDRDRDSVDGEALDLISLLGSHSLADLVDTWGEGGRLSDLFSLNPFSFLRSIPSGASAEGQRVVCMTGCVAPTELPYVWTLSRDRTFRLWGSSPKSEVVKVLPAIAPAEIGDPDLGSSSSASKPAALLAPDPQKLIYAWPVGDNVPRQANVLVFIPTESVATSGGFFLLWHCSDSNSMELRRVLEAPVDSAHCHLQDFLVHENDLCTLWDKEGQSVVHVINLSERDTRWCTFTHPEEHELTPAYLDQLLLASGSLSEKFFEAIMRPGMFSPLTLQTAIDQYTDACRSLPPPYPPQLLTTYANYAEQIAAVVGCTVKLMQDPQTGASQYSNYWNALKRDWEGFIARCREVERSARRPLAIGFDDQSRSLLVSERERVAKTVKKDAALMWYDQLSAGQYAEGFPIVELVWKLRDKLEPRTLAALESRVVDLVHQEIAFPFADIIQDQAQRMEYRDMIDEGLESWVEGRLQAIEDVEGGIRNILDIIGGYDPAVKDEPTDVNLKEMPKMSELTRVFAASYLTATTHVRYELCLSLVALLFLVADDLASWSVSLLTEVFALFRGAAMLRYAVRQPADIAAPSLPAETASNEDDVVAKMRNMQVTGRHPGLTPTFSLIHRLLALYGGLMEPLPISLHKWMDHVGLLASSTPAHATKMEVQFCESLRFLGYREVAREMLAWLPRTPGVTYVLGRLWLDDSRFDDAASVMECIAGSFGTDLSLSVEDKEALAAVLPGAGFFASEFEFYIHVGGLFKGAGSASHEVYFTQLAISVAPPSTDAASLWHGVIRGLTDLGLYEDAYASLMSTPYDNLKRECIGRLVDRMCEESAVQRLMSFNFAGFADEVEDALSYKARNADPLIRPLYSRILYSWYVSRGDYRNAALTMYQRARKLASLIGDSENSISLVEAQLEAYAVSMSALALIDQRNAWIVIPVTAETGHAQLRKRRKLTKHIPENRYSLGSRDAEVIDLADMQYEYTLLTARLELIRREPTLLSAGGLLLPPQSAVIRLAQMNHFNMAIATARSLDVDMSELFGHLARQCLRLSHKPGSVIAEDTSDWLLTDKVSSWPGTPVDRGWRYLRQALERHDGPETDYKYSKMVLETILENDRSSPPPPWLIYSLEVQHPEYLIRTCLRYDNLESALEHTLSLVRKSEACLAQEQLKTASATWLPYTLIDQVLLAADSQENLSPRGGELRKGLRTEIATRMKRVQKMMSEASR